MVDTKIKVAVISGFVNTSKAISKQLDILFGKYITFIPFSTKQWTEADVEIDLALVSSNILARQIASHLKAGTEIIILRRTLLKRSWEKVLSIPHGTRLLVVNDLRDSAEETVALLYELGARHIELIPFYPELVDIPQIDLAITPGESQHVPSFAKQVIDIGERVVDVSTLVDLLTKFGLLNNETRAILRTYSEQIISRSQGLEVTMQGLIHTKNLLQNTLDMVQDGVIAYDNDGIITIFNRSAELILKTRGYEAIGKKIEDLLRREGMDTSILNEEVKDRLIHVKQQNIVWNKLNVESDGETTGAMFTLQVAQKVEELELKLRAQIKAIGHEAKYTFADLITKSEEMNKVVRIAKKVAESDLSVLILGESGTGKELFAHAIHNSSRISKYPFVAVNCSALPDNLLESELFGYEEGAFTGAKRGGKPGLFELAHKGTIFLDEIGDISPTLQSRLLRVIQQKEVLKVGGTKVLPVDVRVIAATNRDLARLVAEGKFRDDLYYRLNVVPIHVPSLRDRKEDIPVLAMHFLKRRHFLGSISSDALALLQEYHWPGNVRELENTMQYLAFMSDGAIEADSLPFSKQVMQKQNRERACPPSVATTELPIESLILSIILQAQQNSQTVGRKKLVQLVRSAGSLVTEYEIRKITERMSQEGLIEVSVGRSGCKLTAKGFAAVKTVAGIG